jgi:hypothetical protein
LGFLKKQVKTFIFTSPGAATFLLEVAGSLRGLIQEDETCTYSLSKIEADTIRKAHTMQHQ